MYEGQKNERKDEYISNVVCFFPLGNDLDEAVCVLSFFHLLWLKLMDIRRLFKWPLPSERQTL